VQIEARVMLAAMAVHQGDVLLGRYEVGGKIEVGTLADVRSARDRWLERTVAIKVAGEWGPVPGVSDPGALFRKEATLSARLQHPHLLPVYDYGRGAREFLVMRHFDWTLRQYLARHATGPFPLERTVALFRPIASAIDYLHEHGAVVHGNLKPDNVVLDTEPSSQLHPFIFDFGVAALGVGRVGTPNYMAPEQMMLEEISPAVDIYALGVMLYETLVGATPFDAIHGLAALALRKVEPIAAQYSARELRPDLPPSVDAVIAGLTQTDPHDRYESASTAVEELARASIIGGHDIAGKIFISYARSDAEYVIVLAKRLRALGVQVWSDLDITTGSPWDNSVEQALRDTDKMLLILSPEAVRSENVRDEWSRFLQDGKPVLPFMLKECEVPYRLARLQHLRAAHDLLIDIARILEALSGQRSQQL
jgi:serine/threonine protein kinase